MPSGNLWCIPNHQQLWLFTLGFISYTIYTDIWMSLPSIQPEHRSWWANHTSMVRRSNIHLFHQNCKHLPHWSLFCLHPATPTINAIQYGSAEHSHDFVDQQIQSSIAADLTDAEIRAVFHVRKKACTLRHFLNSGNFDTIMNKPTHGMQIIKLP